MRTIGQERRAFRGLQLRRLEERRGAALVEMALVLPLLLLLFLELWSSA